MKAEVEAIRDAMLVARGMEIPDPPRPERGRGWIYFIRAGDEGPIKIGYTGGSPAKRLRELQTMSPHRLVLLGACEGSVAGERAWHARYAHCREVGEWFQTTTSLLEEIGLACEWRAEVCRMPPVKRPRITKLEPVIVAWIMGRAGQFFPDGRAMWSYGRIAKNLGRARRVKLSMYQVRRVVRRLSPELARKRGDRWHLDREGAKEKRAQGPL
jgi:hypothetical protein